ncbi:MAG: hypothetical protein LAT58_12010, partial [Opitutales bacterium]|nr:hypothetical protein [Opitutales bacterium]
SFTREGILDVLGSVHPNATVEAVVWPDHPVVLLGDWTAATDPADYHGAHYLHNGNTGQGEKQIRFTAPVEPGQWQVDFRWAEDETHASRTILRLQWPGQETEETFPVDQRTDGGQWNTLHTINVEESGDLRLRVLTAATDGVVTADALRLTRLDDGAEIILDAGGQHSATGNLPTPASGVETATTHSGTNTGGQYHIAIPVDNSAGPVRVNFDVIGTVPGVAWNDTDAVAELSASALVPPAAETYSHDLAGNVTANWRWDFTWDARNQLRSVQTSADAVQAGERNQRLTFSYDAFGRRTIKRVHHWDEDTSSFLLQKSTFYLYNGWDLIRKVTYAGDGINLNDRLTTTAYTWGADHSQVEGGLGGAGGLVLIEHTDHASDTTSTWYPLYEGGGNIIGLVDADTEERVATYEYTPFGRLLRSEGPAAEKNPIRFATKYRDAETGLINFGLRLYDPTTGQWLSRDPMGEAGGLNLYAYTNNDPVNYVDVLGLKGVPCNSPWLEVEGPWNPSNLFNTASAFPRGRSSDSSTGRPNPLQGPGFLFQMETWLALVELQSDALVYGYYHMGDWFHTNAAFASSRASEGSFLWEMTAGANNMVGALITPHTYELAYHHSVDRTALLAGDTHGWRQLPTAFIGAAGELTGMNYLVEGGMGYSLHGDQLDFGDRFLHAYGGGTALFGHGILLRSAMPIRGGLHVNNRIGTNEVSTPTQLELGFVDQLADSSGLVIGRGRHISEAIESGAFAPGEYRLSWFSTLPSNRRATRSELDVEWSINQSYLQAVMKLKRPIRDVSPIDDLGGFFLNRERDALGRAGWNYADGWWNPPTQ